MFNEHKEEKKKEQNVEQKKNRNDEVEKKDGVQQPEVDEEEGETGTVQFEQDPKTFKPDEAPDRHE